MKQLSQQPASVKKMWGSPEIILISQDIVTGKNSIANHEIHNGNGTKITAPGSHTVTGSGFYQAAQSLS